MKFAGEYLEEGVNTHEYKYFFYSCLAVFCACYCGLYFLRMDQLPTGLIALACSAAVAWQFRLAGSVRVSERKDVMNNRAVITLENSRPVPVTSIYMFMLQIYIWSGLSVRRNNGILTSHLAKLPMQFFKRVRVASGPMERSTPWKILSVNDAGGDLNNVLQTIILTQLVDPSHRLLIASPGEEGNMDDLFAVVRTVEEVIEAVLRAYSVGRPMTAIAIGFPEEALVTLLGETGVPIIPVQTRFDEYNLSISIGSPVLNAMDVRTYIQVESNRVSRM